MRSIFKMLLIIAGVAIGMCVFAVPYLNKITDVQRKSEVKINDQIIIAHVLSSPRDRERGLSGRDALGVNEGMLFVFPEAGNYGFWMKDMKFPIDILWINKDQVVGFEENVDPQIGARSADLKTYYPPMPVNKVLELAAGRVNLLRAEAGDLVKIRPLIKTSD